MTVLPGRPRTQRSLESSEKVILQYYILTLCESILMKDILAFFCCDESGNI